MKNIIAIAMVGVISIAIVLSFFFFPAGTFTAELGGDSGIPIISASEIIDTTTQTGCQQLGRTNLILLSGLTDDMIERGINIEKSYVIHSIVSSAKTRESTIRFIYEEHENMPGDIQRGYYIMSSGWRNNDPIQTTHTDLRSVSDSTASLDASQLTCVNEWHIEFKQIEIIEEDVQEEPEIVEEEPEERFIVFDEQEEEAPEEFEIDEMLVLWIIVGIIAIIAVIVVVWALMPRQPKRR